MNATVRAEYKRLRRKGWTASDAMHAAEVNAAFEEAEAEGLVAFEVIPDESADLSFLDQDCMEDVREAEYSRADSCGTWGIVATVNGKTVDSVWGFIGDDWKDSGYDTDVKAAALRVIEPTPSHWCAL